MNLSQIIRWLFAGGPGSGCKGPNCGRPKGSAGYSLVSPVPGKSDIHKLGRKGEGVGVKHKRYDQIQRRPLTPSEHTIGQYQHYPGTLSKTTGTAWMNSDHRFKGHFHEETSGRSMEKGATVHILQGPGVEGGTTVTVIHYSKKYGAPKNRVLVREQDTDEHGNLWRTRTREFVRIKDGVNQIKSRYGVNI